MATIGDTLYFAWVADDAEFDPETHNVQGENVFEARITQAEREFAVADIVIAQPVDGLLSSTRNQRAFISVDIDGEPTLVFDGRILGFPARVDDGAVRVQLQGRPAEWEDVQDAYLESLWVLPYFDPLFTGEEGAYDPDEVLAGYGATIHWPRIGGEPGMTDLIAGAAGEIDLGQNWFRDSLQTAYAETAIKQIDLKVTAEWQQRGAGIFSVEEDIMQAFSKLVANTLTPDQFENGWPVTGATLSGSPNYRVRLSQIKRAEKPPLGESAEAGPFSVNPDSMPTLDPVVDEAPFRDVHFKRIWYDVEQTQLEIVGEYRQHRQESIEFEIMNDLQPVIPGGGTTEELEFTLQDVTADSLTPAWESGEDYDAGDFVLYGGRRWQATATHTAGVTFFGDEHDSGLWSATDPVSTLAPYASSFFQASRGQQALENALRRARFRLAESSRIVEITVEAALDLLIGVTLDHTVRVADPNRLPGGEAAGKVIRYELVWGENGSRYGSVSIACIPGNGNEPEAEEGEVDVEGIIYSDFSSQVAFEPVKAWAMTKTHLLFGVVVENEAKVQISKLNNQAADADLEEILANNPTRFTLQLRPLTSYDTLRHKITLAHPDGKPWPAPKDIDLEYESP